MKSTIWRRNATRAGIAALALAMVDLAFAQQPTPAQQNAIRQSCRSDFQALCAGVQPGGSAALQCLEQNAASVSPGCRQALAAVGGGGSGSSGAPRMTMREELMLTRAECGPDFRTYCQRVEPGGGRALKCLEANGASLTPACQQALMGLKQKMP